MSKTIVLIDDEMDLIEVLDAILGVYADKVVLFDNGKSAIEFINNNNPSLVICDLKMPGVNGVSVLQEHKKTNAKEPFIFYTSYANDEVRADLIGKGAHAVLDKPEFEQLEGMVQDILSVA